MSDIDNTKALADKVGQAYEELKAVAEKQDGEIKAFGETVAETKAEFERVEKELDAKIAALETAKNRAGGAGGDDQPDEAKAAFELMVRKGERGLTPEQAKALATDVDSDGGFLVPETMQAGIVTRLRELSPVRALANVVTLSQGDTLKVPREGATDASAGWVSERGSRSETDTPDLEMVEIVAHEMYAEPQATQKMLDDAGFDVEGWLNARVASKLARMEANAFVTGNGVGKPLGFLDSSAGVDSIDTGAQNVTDFDDIRGLIYELPEAYSANATLALHRAVLKALRTEREGTSGGYIWTPPSADDPQRIDGKPVVEMTDMPSTHTTGGTKIAIYADFREMYTILDRKQIVVLRDPFTNKPFIKFYTTKRVGGAVVNPEAGKILTVKS